MSVKCGKCKEHHDNADGVRECYGVGKTTEPEVLNRRYVLEAQAALYNTAASPLIRRAEGGSTKLHEQIEQATLSEGVWVVDSGESEGIYKVVVAVHGSGHLYAKKLMHDKSKPLEEQVDGRGKMPWAYVPIARRLPNIGRKLSLEEAKEFGKLYGFCVRCGRTLTKESSIDQGMGDICAGKFES